MEFEAGYYKGVCVKTMIFDNIGFEVFGSMGVDSIVSGLDYITYGISPLILKVYDNNTVRFSIALQYKYDNTEEIVNTFYSIVLPRLEYRLPYFDNVWVRIFELNIDYIKKRKPGYEANIGNEFISGISLISGIMFEF
ncbi:MAG: hypothetical protein JXR81_03470, partial [Candidatus Goldbacteria bacterium]|nr:hypothetical protein [Candidatus Goldiibacteriota bacterium]